MIETSFFVRPLDVAFFGPPEAQSAGDTHYSRSLFPPPPRAFQGLVRTRLLAAAELRYSLADRSKEAQRERQQLVGGPDALPSGWQIEGPLPVERIDAREQGEEKFMPWVSAPAFLVRAPEGKRPPLRTRRIQLDSNDHALGGVAGRTRPPEQDVLGTRGFVGAEPLEGWIDAKNLLWALSGEGSWAHERFRPLPRMVRRELRVGLALEPGTRQAKDRMLYAVDQLRFNGSGGFVGTLRVPGGLPAQLSAAALTTGTAPFGRWHRLAALEPPPALVDEWNRIVRGEHLPEKPSAEDCFWMVALTPFRSGTATSGDSAGPRSEHSTLRPQVHSVNGADCVEVLGAQLGKSMVLGGLSLADGKARPNRTYVAAGSAWLFRIRDVTPARRGEILREINGAHCLGPVEEARMGFGRVLVGRALEE